MHEHPLNYPLAFPWMLNMRNCHDPRTGITSAEVNDLKNLIEIEKIRKKKQMYSQLLDSLQLDRWVELFADDAIGEWGPLGDWIGRSGIYEKVKVSIGDRFPYYSMHMTTNMWIEITSPYTASCFSYLSDINNDLSPRINPLKLLGVYEEKWEKIEGDWLDQAAPFPGTLAHASGREDLGGPWCRHRLHRWLMGPQTRRR